jgi:hypothetical protein
VQSLKGRNPAQTPGMPPSVPDSRGDRGEWKRVRHHGVDREEETEISSGSNQ